MDKVRPALCADKSEWQEWLDLLLSRNDPELKYEIRFAETVITLKDLVNQKYKCP